MFYEEEPLAGAVVAETVLEDTVFEDTVFEDTVFEDTVFEDTVRARSASGFTHPLAVVAGVPVGCAATSTHGGWGEVQHVGPCPHCGTGVSAPP